MPVPLTPKIYHIAHCDRLASIIQDGYLWCDRQMQQDQTFGTTIGMSRIKQRRLEKLTLPSYPDLRVGDCVPFYFCPRSIMLYLIHQANHTDLAYWGEQAPILHLEADLRQAVAWAQVHQRRWVFTLSNAGSFHFEDRCDLAQLDAINWEAVQATRWGGSDVETAIKEGKQAEFLIESSFPWTLIERVGLYFQEVYQVVINALAIVNHRPLIEIKPEWYY